MGNLCMGSKLQVHVQPSFTYETILDRFIDSHLPELMLNAAHLSDRRSSLPNYTSTWDDLTSQLETSKLDRRLSMRNEAAHKPEVPAPPSQVAPPPPDEPPPPQEQPQEQAKEQPKEEPKEQTKESATPSAPAITAKGSATVPPRLGSSMQAGLTSKPSLPPITQRSSLGRPMADPPPLARSTEPPLPPTAPPAAASRSATGTARKDVLPSI